MGRKTMITEETHRKMSESAKKRRPSFLGKHHSPEMKAKMSEYSKLGLIGNKGKKFSDETRKKISDSRKGKTFSDEHKMNLSKALKGRTIPTEVRKLISETMKIVNKGVNNPSYGRRGKLSPMWKGGLTEMGKIIRHSLEYRLWRMAVFERDKYTCIWCGDNRGGNLEADHIKPFSLFPELRFAIDNGRTLCHSCHQKTDTYGFKLKHE